MIKRFNVEDLDCANCARKLEESLNKIDGISDVKVNFLTQKITLNVEDNREAELIELIKKTSKKVAHCKII